MLKNISEASVQVSASSYLLTLCSLPEQTLCLSVTYIWTAADLSHSPVRKENQFLRILHCHVYRTTSWRFCFLLLFACSFYFAFALPLKDTMRGHGNPRPIGNKRVSRMKWMEIYQISHCFHTTMKGYRELCDCIFSHGCLLFISLNIGYFPHL